MLSVSSLIEFLMNLLRDEAAQTEFEQDPYGMLARHGLGDLQGQDVRDAVPVLADQEGVHIRDGSQHSASYYYADHDDPVSAIAQLKEHYTVTTVVNESDTYNLTYVDDRDYIDDRDTIVTVDDRDSTTINADGDVTITDSFNQETDVSVTQIEDSFNEDNDGVDNKGGVINDSAVAGEDIHDSFNKTDNSVNDSYKTEDSHNTEGSHNTEDSHKIEDSYDTEDSSDTVDSFNQDNDGVELGVDETHDDLTEDETAA